jgi:hypothetical protein
MKIYNQTKVYSETKEGYLSTFSETFPRDKGNRHYIEFLARMEQGMATLIPYEEPDVTIEEVRIKRDELLKNSDSYVLSDFPRGNVTLQSVKDYRQLLRDFPDSLVLTGIKRIEDVQFPTNPLT